MRGKIFIIVMLVSLSLVSSSMAASETGRFIRRGQLSNSKGIRANVGGFVYAGNTAGALGQTLLVKSGDQVQVVGIAKEATQGDFEPQLVIIEVA